MTDQRMTEQRMTATRLAATSNVGAALSSASDPLDGCLRMLLDAAGAADDLGLPTAAVRETHADAIRRLGFPGDAYVLALVGGTGVGKSSLLNALAGMTVSPASVRRPTTSQPIAWVPAAERDALAPLLDWLGVGDVREHAADDLGPVAILDLPDMDSVATEHRARVEALLPRVDAVAWVTDPEKYHDAVLHDDFLAAWLPRLARQAVVVNKADRLGLEDGRRIRRDLEADLARGQRAGDRSSVPVILTSAAPSSAIDRTEAADRREADDRTGAAGQTEADDRTGAAGQTEADDRTGAAGSEPDLAGLRHWLADGVAAKAIVRARVAATAVDLAHGLARDAGIDPARSATPFLDEVARAAAIEEATSAVLRAVDLPGLERQAEAATRALARARGTGPVGRLTSLLYRASGRATRVADPDGFLVRWRERGPLSPAVEVLREALARPLRAASPALRQVLAAALEPTELRRGLERAVDRAISGLGPLAPPTSRWWSVIGFLQTLATAGIALSAAWVVIWILGGPPASSVQVPVLGSVPSPFASLVGFLAAGYLLARLLGAHAGWVGRRWAQRLRDRVAATVQTEVSQRGLLPLDTLEDARLRLWTATSTMGRTCGRR
ncbi:MAG: GTPase [Candidatus Limnocylindrales bacterium]